MNENIKTQGPTVSEEQLIDVYRSNQDQANQYAENKRGNHQG